MGEEGGGGAEINDWWGDVYWVKFSLWGNEHIFGQWRESPSVLQIRAITINLWPLTAHTYHLMIIMNSGFSKKSLLLIHRNSFEQF